MVATPRPAPAAARAPAPAPAGPALLTRFAAQAAGYLRATAPPPTSTTGLMAAYHMGWADRSGRPQEAAPGKLVRPSLCLWACQAAGSDPAVALPLAAAVEWVHNFTLIHDDIQDGDRERRHRETVWSIWGTAQGINAGDALHAVAFERLLAPGPRAARRLRAGRVLARAVRQVVEGQCLDLAFEGRLDVGPPAYLRMARAKTGALLGASIEAGALVGGSAAALARRLHRAGELLGLAFQVRDDWLGIWGEPALTGKSRDCDLGRRKVTYPVVAGYAAVTPPERRRLRDLFRSAAGPEAPEAAHEAVAEIRALLADRGADRLAEVAAARFAGQSIDLVAGSGLPAESTDQYEEFARYVANRSA
ncbi:MAG TPA: polyprenyl synthetase family protein [Candidatus Dormibacteraeota bacterium]|nr:polyprenyl synthetase family protein [Candidatus Dormibacteraeota bacterium]